MAITKFVKVHEDDDLLIVKGEIGNSTPTPVDAATSDAVVSEYTSGQAISALQLVWVDPTDGRIYPADSTVPATAGAVIGIATTTVASAGQEVSVITHGPLCDPGFSFNTAIDGCLFANGINGQFSQVAPLGPHYNLSIGQITAADCMFVDIGDPILRS